VIVGSALVRRVLQASSPADAAASVRRAVRDLAPAVRR
jgi:tryptophan synthase alpha subunit